MSRGDIGAYPIDQSHDGRIWGTPSNWGFSANVGGYEVNAWGPPGRAHLYSRKTEMHLCADDVAWTGPDESGEGGSAQLGEFSTLGRCEDAAGETITLNYCRVDGDYQGTPPTECPRHEVHVWTSSGSSAVDETFTFHSGGGVYIYTPINNLHAHFGRGGELSIWWDKASEVTRGFLRAAINGEYAVYCILSTDNQSEDALNRLSFQAKKLGTCPAEPIEGDLAICF